jgi:hypothetical protein
MPQSPNVHGQLDRVMLKCLEEDLWKIYQDFSDRKPFSLLLPRAHG